MANLGEVKRAIHSFGKVNKHSNPIGEFFWQVNQATRQDLDQADQILGRPSGGRRLSDSLYYAQWAAEVGYIFTEVFLAGEYKNWQPTSETPRVIDLGGDPAASSALYWKFRAPGAKVTIVEANPATAKAMRQSLDRKGAQAIQVINAAVSENTTEDATLHLHQPRRGWHTQDYVGSQSVEDDTNMYSVTVPRVKLSDIIAAEEQVDLLKMDIEGCEGEAIRDLDQSGKLGQIRQIIMEFHQNPATPDNSLIEILRTLKKYGFTIEAAHITGNRLRLKKKVQLANVQDVAEMNSIVCLNFTARRMDN